MSNPSAFSLSPAKPCAKALPPRSASAPPAKPRRVILPLPFIGKDPDQRRGLHTRQPDHRHQRSAERGGKRDAEQFDELQWKDMEWQAPAKSLYVHHRDQAPRHQQAERQREQGGD